MFTPADRERIRSALLDAARADTRISGGAITGSASVGSDDAWSDIDLAFGVRDAADIPLLLDHVTTRMYRDHGCVEHMDVPAGSWIYRVFLLESTLQVDVAFAPARDFGARAPTFRLMFGDASEIAQIVPPKPLDLIAYAWLYALHVRSSIKRRRLWQATYMLSEMRDRVLALACVRHGVLAREARGWDALPREVTEPLQASLVGRLDTDELSRAFGVVTRALLEEARRVDAALAERIAPVLRELAG